MALKVDFPKQPSRDIKNQEPKVYTYIAAYEGITYAIKATQSSKNLPNTVIEDTRSGILSKAKEVTAQGNYSVNNIQGLQAKYITQKNAYVSHRIFLYNNTIVQLMAISSKGYPDSNKADLFFGSCKMTNFEVQDVMSRSTNTDNNAFSEGDRIEILYPKDQKWYPGIIKKVSNDGYLVSYDGYASSYDETVPVNRLRTVRNIGIRGVKSYIKAEKGKVIAIRGNIREGRIIDDLDFAQRSSMACFPGTRFVEFQGNQIFYWMDLPSRSEVTITVNPLTGKRINVYAFSGFDGQTLPPDVSSCVSCEAGYETWSAANPPRDFTKSAGTQKIQLRAVNSPYRVLIAVSGAKGVTEGDFELKVALE